MKKIGGQKGHRERERERKMGREGTATVNLVSQTRNLC